MDQMLKLSYTDVSENCLNLNIYTPSLPGEKTPITSSTAEQLIYGKANTSRPAYLNSVTVILTCELNRVS